MRFKRWKPWIPEWKFCLMGILWVLLVLPGSVFAQQLTGEAKPAGICPQKLRGCDSPGP